MTELITVGEIVKAQGLAGEVKVRPLTNDILRFKKLRAVYIDTVLYQISGIRLLNDFVYIKLAGFDSREKVEMLIGKFLRIDRLHAVATDDDEYFIADLIGCMLVSGSDKIGEVTNIHQHGAADVFEIKLTSGSTMMFPFLKSLNLQFDAQKKEVSVDKSVLDSVSIIDKH